MFPVEIETFGSSFIALCLGSNRSHHTNLSSSSLEEASFLAPFTVFTCATFHAEGGPKIKHATEKFASFYCFFICPGFG